MNTADPNHFRRLFQLVAGVFSPPPGKRRISIALLYGVSCHAIFGLAVLAMISAMFFGMSKSFGTVPQPWGWAANIILIVQFPLAHSFLLSAKGRAVLTRLAPNPYGASLATTTYAIIASFQLLILFAFWTPSGIIWWQAEGAAFAAICIAYAASWAVLMKASFDAGPEVQSGALGWMSLMQKIKPVFPDMPTTGLFRMIRQPIYVAFALTLWTVPVWTPDQLLLAVSYTSYCLLAPQLKELRFANLYGARFTAYQAQVPYMLPKLRRKRARQRDS